MIPPVITVVFTALGFVAGVALFVWALCKVAKDADEALAARDELASRRARRDVRNGLGGAA